MARRNLPRQETANGTPMLTPPDDLPRAGQRSQRASPQRAAVLQAQPAQISHETTLEERRVLAAYQREQEAILAPTGIREGAGTATTWNQSANQRPRVLEDAARNTTLPQTINAGGSSIDSDEPAMAALLAQHEGNSEYDVQNMQTRKQSFINGSRAQRSADYLPSTRTAPLSKFEIKAGWEIPAVLEQGLNSDLPGELKALVTSNVYDTGTGLYLLIPQGSRLIGKYDSRVSYGQDGVQVAWDRIIFPDASSVDLNGMVGLDAHGNAGLRDKVDRHYKRLLGFSALTSLFTAAFDVSQRRNQSALNYPSPTETAASAVGRDISETGASITRRNLNVQPTIKVPVGYKFTVRVNRDIVFDAPYELIGSDARRTTVPPRRLLQ
jgi:type IV secretory pathway VirB10-like protein